MQDSAQDVPTEPARHIEIRLVAPKPRVSYQNGKVTKEHAPDMDWIIEQLTPGVTEALQQHFGDDTAVTIKVSTSQDIRLQGHFQEKAPTVKEQVGEILAQAFEGLSE